MKDSYMALLRQAIFTVLDEREWDFTNDEQRVDFADRVMTWFPAQQPLLKPAAVVTAGSKDELRRGAEVLRSLKEPPTITRSQSQRKEGDGLRLSDGGFDQPIREGKPQAWLVEDPKGNLSVTLKDAEAPAFWIDGKVADGYKVTPLFAPSSIAEPIREKDLPHYDPENNRCWGPCDCKLGEACKAAAKYRSDRTGP